MVGGRTLFTLTVVALLLSVAPAAAQTGEDASALHDEVVRLNKVGKYAEAARLGERVVAIREQSLGPEHRDVGIAIANLADAYNQQGHLQKAEPLYLRALAIIEKSLGPDHTEVAILLETLSELYQNQRRFADAERLLQRTKAILEAALGPNHFKVGLSLNGLAKIQQSQRRYAEASTLFGRALEIFEKALGNDHPFVGSVLGNLATLHDTQGLSQDAESFYRRALTVLEKAFGSEHPNVGHLLNNLGEFYRRLGRHSDAEPLYQRALAIREKATGPDHLDVSLSLDGLATLYVQQGRFAEGEPIFARALKIREKALGPDHPDVALSLNSLAVLYESQGRFAESEANHKRALRIREKAFGPDNLQVAQSLGNLAIFYGKLGRNAEAEPLHRRALVISESILGANHARVGEILNNLATVYWRQRRLAEAEPLFKRAIAIGEAVGGHDHPTIGMFLDNLGALYFEQGRASEAEPLMKRAIAILEKALGPDHPRVGQSLNNLAMHFGALGRAAEAEPLYKRSLAISEKALGPDHPMVATALNNLAHVYQDRGHVADAEPLHKRALSIRQRALGPDHPDVAESLGNVADFYLIRGDLGRAAEHWRLSTAITRRRAERGLAGPTSNAAKGEAARLNWHFSALVKATHRLAAGGSEFARHAEEMFEFAQWVQASDAAESLAQMAARGASGKPAIAQLVRERQDLVGEWQTKDKLLIAARSEATERRNQAAESALATRLAEIDKRLGEIDKIFASEFPDFAALASPKPVSVADVQSALGTGEALVLILDTKQLRSLPEETFVWIIAKTGMRWIRSPLGSTALSREVSALRCGLDAAAWYGEGESRCAGLLKLPPEQTPREGASLPFDLARAHALYKGLFGEAQDLIAGKQLLIVPTGALSALPFQVLVKAAHWKGQHGEQVRDVAVLGAELSELAGPATAALPSGYKNGVAVVQVLRGSAAEVAGLQPKDIILAINGREITNWQLIPDTIRSFSPRSTVPFQVLRGGERMELNVTLGAMTLREWKPHYYSESNARDATWLGQEHALAILPAISSLKALRAHAKASIAEEPFIGFGNPLLVGTEGTDHRAFARQTCPAQQIATRTQALRSGPTKKLASLFRGGLANVEDVRRQVPLPETADELCAVARSQGVSDPDAVVHLGNRATEQHVKALSARGTLARSRVVHFATHGLIAGETASLTSSKAEPALMLTPPDQASEEDDGLLTASEVAALKFDADWVILSACNTAAGDSVGGDALSGLARAFFYAGARALLVSHWAVDSDATVELVTKAFGAMERDPRIGRAEAIRQAISGLIGSGGRLAHPSNWAPFVVVGEGGGAGTRAVAAPAVPATVSPASNGANVQGARTEELTAAPVATAPAPSAKTRGRTKPIPAKPSAPADDWTTRVFRN